MDWDKWVEKAVNILKGKFIDMKAQFVGRDLYIFFQLFGKQYNQPAPKNIDDAETLNRIVSSPEFKNVLVKEVREYVAPYKPRLPELSEPERDRLIVDAVNSSMASSLACTSSSHRPEYGEGSGLGVMDPSGEQATLNVGIGPVPPKKPGYDDGEGMM